MQMQTEIFLVLFVPHIYILRGKSTVEPRFNEPLFNEVLDITNDILCPGQSYSKIYGIEPRYNELQCQYATEDKR